MVWRIQFFCLSILAWAFLNYLPLENEVAGFLLCGFGVVTLLRLFAYWRFQSMANKGHKMVEAKSDSWESVHVPSERTVSVDAGESEKPRERSVGQG